MPTINKKGWFDRFASKATKATGSNYAFIIACVIILVWIVSGPIFHYSDTWQLVINTGTTIITFLMVFLIQKTQNKDGEAIQIKLNELVAANRQASNRIINIEDLTERELDELHEHYITLAEKTKNQKNKKSSCSIDDTPDQIMKKEEAKS
jgi:low affinity Fe/Cu permease